MPNIIDTFDFGDGIERQVSAKKTEFIGTKAQWEALSAAEQAQYNVKYITDDFNGIPVDSELSNTSTNPVQNKVVTAALNNKANASDVNSQIQTLTNQVNYNTENGVKNLFHFQSLAASSYLNITWTFDGVENTIKMNSSSASTSGSYYVQKELELDPSKQYVFKATFDSEINNGLWLTIIPSDEDATYRKAISPSTPMIEYTPKAGVTKYYVYVYTNASMTYSNYNIANIMVVEKDVYNFNPSYEPYAKSNQQLTEDTTALLDNTEVNGAVNIASNNMTNKTTLGVTFTVGDDGAITASGTATGNIRINIGTVWLKKGITYRITDTSDLSESDQNQQLIVRTSGGTWIMASSNTGDTPNKHTPSNDFSAVVTIAITSGQTVSKTFYPMVSVVSYTGPYVPYAKSNKELTEDVADLVSDGKPYNFGIMGTSTKPSFLNGDTLASKTILEIFNALPINYSGGSGGIFAIGSEISVGIYSDTNTLFTDLSTLTGLSQTQAGLLTIKKFEAQRGLVTYNMGNKIFNCRIINSALETCYYTELTPVT